MENNQNFFENWMNAQKSMVDNWIQVGKNIQENSNNQTNSNFSSFSQVNPMQEWSNKSTEMMNNWQKMMNSWSETTQNQSSEKVNEFGNSFNQWMETQKSAVENWTNQIKNVMAQSNSGFNNAFSFNPMNNWTQMASQWQKNMMDSMYSNSNNMMNNFQNMGFNWSNDTIKNVFSNVNKNSEIFNSMMNTYNQFQKNAMSGVASNWKEFFTPKYMKDLMDKMFGFDMLEMQKNMFTNWNSVSNMFQPYMNNFQNSFQNGVNSSNPFGNMMTDAFKNMNSMTAPFFKVMAPGKDKSILENNTKMVEKFAAFIEKTNEIQLHYYKTAYTSMEAVMNDYKNMLEEGKSFETFQEFFNHWTKTTETSFVSLFDTDEYTKLQGELMSLDLDIKSLANEQMEIMLEPFPVMLKKDMDEVYMSNYELRKRVRTMEKELEALKSSLNLTVETQSNPVQETEAAVAEETTERKNGRTSKK